MRKTCIIISLTFSLFTLQSFADAQAKRPLELADMFSMERISEPALSPDGKWVVYTITTPDLATNKNSSDLWLTSIDGKVTRQLTTNPASDRSAAWSPDGKKIAFVSKRSGDSQIWLVNPEDREEKQFTTLSTGASKPVWSPDGRLIAFVSEVFPEYSALPFAESDSMNGQRLFEMKHGNVKAKIFTHLLYRHWDHWVDGKRQHIFVQPVDGGEPRDLTPGDRDAVPTSSTFSAGIDYAFSPDSKEIAYTATPVPVHEEAWSTNYDIYIVPAEGGQPKQLTTNPAADGCPRYSPDGNYIAYRAQRVPGFEADRWQLFLYDRTTGSRRSLTENFDANAGSQVWSPDSRQLYFESEDKAHVPIFSVSVSGNDVKKIFDKNSNHNLDISPDGKILVFSQASAVRPTEVYRVDVNGKNFAAITSANDELFAALDIPPPESIWYAGDGGTKIQAWIFKPAGAIAGKKYPLVYMVHGGPQGAWNNSWSYRWNPALWAAQGYVIMAPNPRGSTGFGQMFTNEISRDWGGKVFVDLMRGVDYAVNLPYVDSTRMAAAGASFGGYMMNWFQGHTFGRFKTLVTHDGPFNSWSMWGTTDELWFDEWEHGGTPWDNPEGYEKYSANLFAKNFSTPNLIIHNQLDFRVPVTEGMQLFSTLQRRGIRSEFLYFPDENHWVLKPANSQLWHNTVFEWLAGYLKRGDAQE